MRSQQFSNASRNSSWVHLFEWPWKAIGPECETVLGPAGVAAVQISPPQEHRLIIAPWWNPAVQFPWFQRYQPVSYRLESRSGSRAELISMVAQCQRAGVQVIADVVLNHMVGYGAGTGFGSGGGFFDPDRWRYPRVPYDRSAFHDPCGIEPEDYLHNADRVQRCQLLGLQDLKTGDPAVQAKQVAYLDDLLSIGVAGLRIDAAKHMAAADIGAILAQTRDLNPQFHGEQRRPIVFQEVINTRPEAVTPEPYLANGAVTEFRYGQQLGRILRRGDWQALRSIGSGASWLPSHGAIVFIHNHDSQRGHGAGGFDDLISWFEPADGGRLFGLALVFTWAWPYGTPRLTSSYDWVRDWETDPATGQRRDRNDWMGPPADAQGRTLEVTCGEGWICEHRRSDFLAMVRFRQAMGMAPVSHWWPGPAGQRVNRVAFGRGDRGFVLLNGEPEAWVAQLSTGLPPGHYCDWLTSQNLDSDRLNSDNLELSCPLSAQVSATGLLQVTVPPHQAVVLARDG
ncbi:MAG: alpha-amylase, partial [Prochlorothrix sp.]